MSGSVDSVVFSPDSTWLGISTENGQVLGYNLGTKQPKTLFQTGLPYRIAFSADNTQLITLNAAGIVEQWNLTSFKKTGELAGQRSGVTSVAVSPPYMALGMTDTISILSPDGEHVSDIESPGDHQRLAFNTDGSMLASSNSAGLIEVWKNESGNFVIVGSLRREVVHSLGFNPGGSVLAVGSRNGVFLIDPSNVKEIARIPHAGAVTGLSYSANGDIMATASLKTIQFWQMPLQASTSDDLVHALPQEAAQVVIDKLKADKSLGQLKIVENEPADLGGNDGFRLVYTYRYSDVRYKSVFYGMLHGEEFYRMVYSAPVRYYFDKDVAAFEQIVKTFKLAPADKKETTEAKGK